MSSSSFNTLLLVALFIPFLVSDQALADDKKRAERDKALAEADSKAFEANMAAYQAVVRPFLEKHCISCHGPKKLKGDLALDLLDPDMKESTSASRWAVVRDKIEQGEMPPEKRPRPSAVEAEKALSWIRAEMKRARRNFTRRLQEIQGNKVPHELLFDPASRAKLAIFPRVRRHSPEIYEGFRKEQAKGFDNLVGNPFTPDPRFLFKDMGAPKLDVPTTSQLLRNAVTILERQTGHSIEKGKLKPMLHSRKEFLQFVDPDKPLGRKEMLLAISMQFKRTLGRTPKEAEQARFLELMEKNVREAGRVAGVRYTLAAVYLLPETIFRWEVGGEVDDEGRTRLASLEIAHALAYALTDKRPPQWLLQEAEKGALDDKAGVTAALDRMFEDERLARPRLLRFFHEFFQYNRATEVFKNPEDFKAHKARVLVSDTDNLVRWIIDRDKDVLRELLTTDRAFVNTRYDKNKKSLVQHERKGEIHRSYSLPPDWKWTGEQPIRMPAGTRAGILTQPSWLVAWSMNQDNHAILRGKWVRERLLGNVVPDIPITVDAQLPHAPEKTLRERMGVTREKYCWQCHKLMNPVGLPFETFDHFGRWRARELGRLVDASGKIDLTGDKRIDENPVTGAIDFLRKLSESERVEQVFVRHVFRYFTGRNENLGDGPSLRAAHKAYRESGGSFRALVSSVLSSDSFLLRTPAPKESERKVGFGTP